jgi:hypothetical protein
VDRTVTYVGDKLILNTFSLKIIFHSFLAPPKRICG